VIRLLQNYYKTDDERDAELVGCLRANAANSHLELVVLAEHDLELPGATIVRVNSRPTFTTVFEYLDSVTGPHDVNVFANCDIRLDETAMLFERLPQGHAYAITRQDALQRDESGTVVDSQDCWAFRGRIGLAADFYPGELGCDNRLLWLIREAGYTIHNPALSILLHHVHSSGHRDYGVPVPGPYHFIAPAAI